ncbi:PAS domain-containing sensor histidine kinase [Lysobacter soli]|uniref:PAS domain-containing sensor histidine kinase n=1 Tax=Lysobacter soli TaxID=453783 RepID=UPI0024103C3B|nr:PAS domain-containing protein [Lysobacter soli]MDG2517876.1 PAS domain-containing protein [Lysobacter soli]
MSGNVARDGHDTEIARLTSCLSDLRGLLARSTSWSVRHAYDIDAWLAEVLLPLLRLEYVVVELGSELHGARHRDAPTLDLKAVRDEIQRSLGADLDQWPTAARISCLGRMLSVATLPAEAPGVSGTLIAAATRDDFPTSAELLVLSVAREQALLALQQSKVQSPRRDRVAHIDAESLIEGLPGLVAILGPDGRVETVNSKIKEYCGQTIEELRDWGTNGTVHPEDMPNVAQVFGGSIASGMPYVIEQRLRRYDGAYRWFDNRGQPLRDESGAILAWYVLLFDIDDRKRAEQAVRANERNLHHQAETFPQMLWSATAEGNIDYCNERLLAYSGLTAETVMNDRWVNLLHPDDRAPTAEIWRGCIASGSPYSVEVRHFHVADQTYRWILTLALPLRDGDGRVVKWYGSCVDIHDRKVAEEALRASERRLAQTIDTIPANVFSAGTDGSVNYLNARMREWFGRAEEKIMASEWVHLTHPEDRDATVRAWRDAVSTGTPYRRKVRFLHHSGEYRWCDNQARPLRDAAGAIIAWHGVVNDIHDRTLAEDALLESERNLRLTIDTIPTLAWSARADGGADFFNRHYLDYVGLQEEELRDWQWTRVIHPDDLAAIIATWEQLGASGTGGEAEARVRRHDGAYRWFGFRAHPLRNDKGEVIKWYGANVDIDEQKRATMMLADERQLLELIASGKPLRDILAMLCLVTESALPGSMCEVRLLEGTGTVFEFSVSPSRPSSLEDLLTGRPVEPSSAPCAMAVAAGAQVVVDDLETDQRCQESKYCTRVVEHGFRCAWSTPVRSRVGGILGTLCVYHHRASAPGSREQDMIDRAIHIASIAIERSRAEDELRRREYLLRTAERISETGSFSWDLINNKLVWSEQMFRIWEVEPTMDLGPPALLPIVHPDDRALVEEKIARIFRGEENAENVERIIMPDGRVKYLSQSTVLFHYDDGRRECIGVSQDITRRRQAEEAVDKLRSELAHATRVMTLGELAASIAHEVNQPLSGILANASACLRMLAAEEPDVEGAARTAQRSIRDANRASEVIKRLRGLYGKHDFTPENFDLNEAAQEVISLCAHDLQRRGIVVKFSLDERLPPLRGDRIQLQQVILNLVLNAAEALASTDNGARVITLESSAAEAGMAQFAVRDTGHGVAAENLDRIFEAFFTTKPHGMGMGLSVSKTIVERHGGRLWANANDGPGSTFALSIPCTPS